MRRHFNKSHIFAIIGIGILLFIFSIPILMFFGVWDYFFYNKSVSTKEDVFEMVVENEEEFGKIVNNMKALFEDSNENIIVLRGRREYKENKIKSPLFKEYPISVLAIEEKNKCYEVSIHLKFCPKEYNYWGIYYTDNDKPSTWEVGTLEDVNGVYTQVGSYYKYETEKIIDHWYYYQCWTK